MKRMAESPDPPQFSCLVRTATIECNSDDKQQIIDLSQSFHATPRQHSISVEPKPLPQSKDTSSITSTPYLSPPINSRSRVRRNTICCKIESEPSKDIKDRTSDVGNVTKISLNPPKIQRRSSAPHLNMKEISTLARAGISTSNLLNFITVSDSLEKLGKD